LQLCARRREYVQPGGGSFTLFRHCGRSAFKVGASADRVWLVREGYAAIADRLVETLLLSLFVTRRLGSGRPRDGGPGLSIPMGSSNVKKGSEVRQKGKTQMTDKTAIQRIKELGEERTTLFAGEGRSPAPSPSSRGLNYRLVTSAAPAGSAPLQNKSIGKKPQEADKNRAAKPPG
jgi:hypothetical protein